MTTEVARGLVVPHGRRLALALAAGALWVLAVVLLVPYPAHARRGILEMQGLGGEGVPAFLASLRLLGAGLLLVVAHVLSSRAHGTALLLWHGDDGMRTRTPVPRLVLAVRVLTWTAVAALVVGTLVAESLVSTTDCFRTCRPFPD